MADAEVLVVSIDLAKKRIGTYRTKAEIETCWRLSPTRVRCLGKAPVPAYVENEEEEFEAVAGPMVRTIFDVRPIWTTWRPAQSAEREIEESGYNPFL